MKPKEENVFNTNVTTILPDNLEESCIFSTRVRDRGPDFRTFVKKNKEGLFECCYETCKDIQDARRRSQSHSMDCEHIMNVKAAATMCSFQQHIVIERNALEQLPFTPKVKEHLQKLGESSLVQRVSKESFVVKCPGSLHL